MVIFHSRNNSQSVCNILTCVCMYYVSYLLLLVVLYIWNWKIWKYACTWPWTWPWVAHLIKLCFCIQTKIFLHPHSNKGCVVYFFCFWSDWIDILLSYLYRTPEIQSDINRRNPYVLILDSWMEYTTFFFFLPISAMT